jgi:hypothetical protein
MYQDITFCTNCGENQISSCLSQRKGVCQGCGLYLYFFNILTNNTEYLDIQGICSLVISGLIISGLFIQKNPTNCNSVSKFIIPYLYETQHVSGNTPPIIRSLKLYWRPLVLRTWKVYELYESDQSSSYPSILLL